MNSSNINEPSPTKTNKNNLMKFNETFESMILNKPQRFMLDKTLCKGIKQNDPSKIVQNGEQADLGHIAVLYNQHKQVQDLLVSTRKKYDHIKQTVVKMQQKIQKLKNQKEMLDVERNKIQASFTQQQKEFRNIKINLEKLNKQCQEAQYTKQIRIQMSEVLKVDMLFYKKHCFEANSRIVRNHNKIKTLNGQFQSSKKVSTNCRSLVYSIDKKISQKQTQRYDKISSYHQIINKKMQNNYKRQGRQKMIQASMLEALNGKMPEQQQQKKLLFVNLALKKMLKMKMQRQMERSKQIQTTFRKIKQNTTVKKADQFIQKFIKREKNYGELLQGISRNQDKINLLKQDRQILQRQNHQIMFQKQAIEDIQTEKRGQANKQINMSIDVLRQKLLINENLKNKTLNFAVKFVSSFDQKNVEEVKQKLSRNKPNISLKEALTKVNNFLDSIKDDQSQEKLKQIYIESSNLNLPQNIKIKNMRIKTLSSHDQNISSTIQDHNIVHDDLSERQFLNQNRKQIKKSAYLRNRIKTRAY